MGSRGAAGYHGRYTASEFAMVKGELLKRHADELNVTAIDHVCRYVAKHNWPGIRKECYTAAVNSAAALSPAGLGREYAAIKMLRIYDEAQGLFDAFHHGENFSRNYEELPEETQYFLNRTV